MIVVIVLLRIPIVSVEGQRPPRGGVKASPEILQVAAGIGVAQEIVEKRIWASSQTCGRLLFKLPDALLLQTGIGEERSKRNPGVTQADPFFDCGLIEIGM